MRRRSLPAAVWGVTAFLVIAVLGIGQDVLHHALGQLLAAAVLAGGSFWAGYRRGRRGPARKATDDGGREHAALRRQVAELEALAHRPIGIIIESYRTVQGRYRTGGRS